MTSGRTMTASEEIRLIRRMENDYVVANGNLSFSPQTQAGKKEWLKYHEYLPEELIYNGGDLGGEIEILRSFKGGTM